MKKTLLIVGLMAFSMTLLFAQKKETELPGSPTKSNMFNVNTIETFESSVESLVSILEGEDQGYGIHLIVKNKDEKINVHIGPSWYVEEKKFEFSKGDILKITGSRITYKGKPTIIAKIIEKNTLLYILRDKNGYPLWSGHRNKEKKRKKWKT